LTVTITITQTIRLRGGGEGNDEDLYSEPSDEEEEEATRMSNKLEGNRTIERGKVLPITKAGNEERTAKANKVDITTTTKKKMKVTKVNLPFRHVCNNISIDNDTPYIQVYCQNVYRIFDRDGIGLGSAFREIKQAGADIFTFNETHGDESNALARRITRMSKQRMWKDHNEDCKIIHSSSTAPVLNFTEPGGNMEGITGSLVGRVRDTITDPYGRWCGYTVI
jgi:hypothetical protein